jgi:hypothetical protein
MTAADSLISAWRNVASEKAPYILKGDEFPIKKLESKKRIHSFNNYEEFINNPEFGNIDSKGLHLNLVPVPYAGSLRDASIYILLLNPGFMPLDYYAESNSEEYRSRLWANLRQEVDDLEFPNLFLDPKFIWTGGGQYWTRKLNDIIKWISSEFSKSYTKALRCLSQDICFLQYLPYNSQYNGLSDKLLTEFRSSQLIRNFVREDLLPRAESGKASVVVTRKTKLWGLNKSDKIVVYKGSESRGASLSINSRGGQLIQNVTRKELI